MFPFRVVSVTPKLPKPIDRLRELAYDFWFSWNPVGIEFFRSINPDLWREVRHNPVKFLMSVQEKDLEAASQDEEYLFLYKRVFELYDRYLTEDTWFSKQYPEHKEDQIAYFSAEFGLHESHPIYSGGLGLLAGDHCKSASDLGLPFTGVGLLYKQGYFDQRINAEGWQEVAYPYLNFYELPITRVNKPDGSLLTVPVDLPGRTVHAQVWRVKVGRVNIYLLDTDNPKNTPEDRLLTGQLYGGDRQYRLSQEILLGIGGVRALRAVGINPRAWHINEGHAAFLVVERIRELMRYGISFDTARELVRASTIFTTHTPVPAGHDIFNEEMIKEFFEPAIAGMGIEFETFKNLAWDNPRNGFNMTLLAINHSYLFNGVSRLHGKVSRDMFSPYCCELHPEEIPVKYITNGVHVESWLASELKEIFPRFLGKGWTKQVTQPQMWGKIDDVPDRELWRVHRFLKEKMINFVRASIKQQRRRNLEPAHCINEVEEYLDPDILTIGFARRFATYKRATLLFRDRERLARLVNDRERPVRFVYAGKAHPADAAGHELISQIYELSNQPEFRGKVLLLENYDIHMARHLVQGVDVWLNTPRRPLEASGTSGQKAALNGLINASTLDGWWPEAYNGNNGFAIGTEDIYHDNALQDRDDCYSLFNVLEERLIPVYYRREGGMSPEWIQMMKNSIKTIAPVFNTDRMVAEYAERFYIPAIKRGKTFEENNNYIAIRAGRLKKFLSENWDKISFVSVKSSGRSRMLVGESLEISAVVNLGPVKPQCVTVEIVYGNVEDTGLKNIKFVPMEFAGEAGTGIYNYKGTLLLPQGAMGYTVRVRPGSKDFSHAELPLVTWDRGFKTQPQS